MAAIALIPTNLEAGRLGLPARLDERLGGVSVLAQTAARVARIPNVDKIVVVHPEGQDLGPLLEDQMEEVDTPILTFADPGGLMGPHTPRWIAARKWALNCWRGGLSDATVYDELQPWGPLVRAIQAHGEGKHGSALLVGGDWCLVDPGLCERVLARHLENVESMKVAFSQAPPGLSGIATCLEVLEQLDAHGAGVGSILGYQPRFPQPDPVGRDANVAVPPSVRNCFHRFIYDTPRAVALIRAIHEQPGQSFAKADAACVVEACRAVAPEDVAGEAAAFPPQQVTLELTPRRNATGPITPQHYASFERPDLDADLARRIVNQLGATPDGAGHGQEKDHPTNFNGKRRGPHTSRDCEGVETGAGFRDGSDRGAAPARTDAPRGCHARHSDVVVLLGGLGDALLHPQWDRIVLAARRAGVLGIGLETDLLCDRTTLARLLELPLDLVTVRLNADSAETYRQVMGVDGFRIVAENLEWLINERRRRDEAAKHRNVDHEDGCGVAPSAHPAAGLPWIVPRMVKTAQTLPELEPFFDKWTVLTGHAVIEPATCGGGAMPAQSPVAMAPSRRRPCRQLGRRMTILSNGQMALCDQDWLGRGALGDAKHTALAEIWRCVEKPVEAHRGGRFAELTLCGSCDEWHRP